MFGPDCFVSLPWNFSPGEFYMKIKHFRYKFFEDSIIVFIKNVNSAEAGIITKFKTKVNSAEARIITKFCQKKMSILPKQD